MANFKVIIIGGGPVGLTAAHALSKAGIDFVVLEARPQVVEDVGASIVLITHSIRVLAQLGMLDKLRELGHEVMRWADYNQKGQYNMYWLSEYVVKNHGHSSLMCHRADLVQCLYESLADADRARVHVGKRLADVETTADGVVVTCADGSTYEGTMVLGADGVHSATRSLMRAHALRADPACEPDLDAERPFPAAYRTMWCTVPRRWEFTPGDHHVTHGDGASLQLLNGARRAWVFVYEKLPANDGDATTTTERVRYTEEDMAAFAERHGDMLIGGRTRLRDVVRDRKRAGMANLEEGVLKRWSLGGRFVLAGDACHKYTPNAGQGLNNGIQDVAVLANELHRLAGDAAGRAGPGAAPREEELAAAFARYQAARSPMIHMEFKLSAAQTRLCAWPNWLYWFVDQWVLPSIPFGNWLQLNYVVGHTISHGQCLEYLEGDEPFEGEIPWAHPIPKAKESWQVLGKTAEV